jgi:hypothetical protein
VAKREEARVTQPTAAKHTTRQTFVSPKVKENEATTRIIDTVYSHYPKQVMVIGGFLSETDAVWKINWHWELLIEVIDKAIAEIGLSERHEKAAKAIRAVLMSNPPNPTSGYRAKNVLGDPQDKSSMDTVRARHRILKQSKKDVQSVIAAAGIKDALSKATKSLSILAVQPVRMPDTTNHRFGWALDIKGRAAKVDNPEIIKISKGLGCTLAFDEEFHIHVEWKDGVKTAAGAGAPRAAVADAPPPSERPQKTTADAPALEAGSWDVSGLLVETGRSLSRVLSDLF